MEKLKILNYIYHTNVLTLEQGGKEYLITKMQNKLMETGFENTRKHFNL